MTAPASGWRTRWSAALQRRWYEDSPPPLLLRPVAALYGGAMALRRLLYRRGALRRQRLPVPVLVVGNLTVGGAGKTPLTLEIVRALRERGWRPGVVSRGHGRRSRGALRVRANDSAVDAGDEPLLYAAAGIPVAVAVRRADAAALLLEEGCDLIVADDGLQHYALARDLEILVVDGRRRFGNGALLPAGPLREPLARARRCDMVVVNGGSTGAGEYPMELRQHDAVPLSSGDARTPLSAFAGRSVHALAGIGDPARFFDALRAHGIECIAHPFPDHHAYRAGDLLFPAGVPVLMTSKDAVKCRGFAQPGWFEVPVRALLPEAFHAAHAARLQALAEVIERQGAA